MQLCRQQEAERRVGGVGSPKQFPSALVSRIFTRNLAPPASMRRVQPEPGSSGGYRARPGSDYSDPSSSDGLTAPTGDVYTLSLRFVSPEMERLYLEHAGAARGADVRSEVFAWMLLSLIAYAAFTVGLWWAEGLSLIHI